MKKFSGLLFALVLALSALVSNESKAEFVMPSYGNGYGSFSPVSRTTVTTTFRYVPTYPGMGVGGGCNFGACGNFGFGMNNMYGNNMYGGGFGMGMGFGFGNHGFAMGMGGGFFGRPFAYCGPFGRCHRRHGFRRFSFNLSIGWGGARGFGGFNLGINSARYF